MSVSGLRKQSHISSTNPQASCPHASPRATSYTDGCWVSGCGSGEAGTMRVQLWAARMESQAGGRRRGEDQLSWATEGAARPALIRGPSAGLQPDTCRSDGV